MILPRRIYDLGLSHKAVSVYCYLANRADKNGECFPAIRRIAEDLNLSKSTIYRAFNELEERGLLERKARYHTRAHSGMKMTAGKMYLGCLKLTLIMFSVVDEFYNVFQLPVLPDNP